MILLYFPIFLISVACAQQGVDYHNDFQHNQRYDRVQGSEVISSTPVKVPLNPEDDSSHHQQRRQDQLNTRRGSRTFSYEEVEDDGSYDGSLVDTIPGKAGKDYPAYAEIPKTSFNCDGKTPSGYFADVETDCQVFHICLEGGQKISFLCPNGSIFNQKVSVCDWWYDADCSESQDIVDFTNDIQRDQIYHDNSNENNNNNININHNNNYNEYPHFIVEETYDLNLASSGGNQHPRLETKQKEQDKLASENKKKEQETDAKKKFIRKKQPSSSTETT